MKTVKISVRIPENMFIWLRNYVALKCECISDVIREAIYLYVEDNTETGGIYNDEKN